MRELKLQNVLIVLSEANIDIVAIHKHIINRYHRIIFLHYWGVGNAETLAKRLDIAIDKIKYIKKNEEMTWQEDIMSTIKSIDPKTANEWLQKNEAILIDVREPEEYNTMHISYAHLIPVGTIEINKLPNFQNKKVIVHCKLGKRGRMACEKLLSENSNLDVYNIEGGIDRWKQSGLPVEVNKDAPIDIMRQVQITAGILVLIGVILSFIASFYFILLSGFVGLGLLLSGITGYCGMATLLMRMPWNKQKSPIGCAKK